MTLTLPRILTTTKKTLKGLAFALLLFIFISAIFWLITTPKQNKNWAEEHAILADITIQSAQNNTNNPLISIQNIRDFQWSLSNEGQLQKQANYKNLTFQLHDITGLKLVVSHFSPISEIAHVYLIIVLNDGREFGVSIEARREQDENFSLSGGLFSQFEILYVLASTDDLLKIRKLHHETVHIYPIKITPQKAQAIFLSIAAEVKSLNKTPQMYHLFFKNCTNQLVKHVSTISEKQYPWFFQTFAPGDTGKILYKMDLIDLPKASFKTIKKQTLVIPD